MKKVLLSILTFILSVCCVGLIACGEVKTDATLVDFVDSSVKIEYGMNYQIEEFVYDTNGVRYELTAKVTDSNNQPVAQNGAFKAEDDEYKVVYSVEFNGSTKTKTVTVSVYSTPIVTLADVKEYTYNIGILPAELPEITAKDGDNDFTESEIKKEVYFVGKFATSKITEYDGISHYYMPTKTGTYFWKVSVTNADGITNSATLYFHVITPTGSVDVIPEEGGESIFSMSKGIIDGFVENKDIPTTYKDENGNSVAIDNKVGYTGNAYKFSAIPHNVYLYFNLSYTAKEYIAMSERGDFDAICFSILITNYVTADGKPVTNSSGTLNSTIINNDQGTNNSRSMLSAAGYAGSSSSQRSVAINKWHTYTVPVADFVQMLGSGLKGLVIRTFYSVGSTNTCDIYVGEIKTVTLPKLPQLKDTDIMDFTADPTQTLFGYDYVADSQTIVTTVNDAQGNQISQTTETKTDAVATAPKAGTVSVFAQDLPKKNLNYYDTSTTNDSLAVDIAGTCPDPNALKIGIRSRATAYFVKLRYNKDQIKAMATAGGYEKIRITYMIDMTIQTGSNGWYWTQDSTNGALKVGSNKDKTYYNTWITLEYTIDEFIAFMGVTPDYVNTSTPSTKTTTDEVSGNVTTVTTTTINSWKKVTVSENMLFLNSGFRPTTCDLYVSGISFVSPTAE